MDKPNHIAFIMDGNGRWANTKGLSRLIGHNKGLESMKEIIRVCLEQEIRSISFFAFSTENWDRPISEVNHLIKLLKSEIINPKLLEWLNKNNVRFIWNGFTTNLPIELVDAIKLLMIKTQSNSKMNLQIMFNYGSQQKIVEAVNCLILNNKPITNETLTAELDKYQLGMVDLLIRTSGEQRLSNFMLYELSYSEIIFNKQYWPDYNRQLFLNDLLIFSQRKRRFGKI